MWDNLGEQKCLEFEWVPEFNSRYHDLKIAGYLNSIPGTMTKIWMGTWLQFQIPWPKNCRVPDFNSRYHLVLKSRFNCKNLQESMLAYFLLTKLNLTSLKANFLCQSGSTNFSILKGWYLNSIPDTMTKIWMGTWIQFQVP